MAFDGDEAPARPKDAAHPAQGIVDMKMLGYLQAGAGALSVASKVPQIWTIWQEGGTGMLSAFAVCATCEQKNLLIACRCSTI